MFCDQCPSGCWVRLQKREHAAGVFVRAGSEQTARRFHHVARPDEMVTTLIIVTLAESPRNGEAGDESAGRCLGLVRAQDGEAHLGKIARSDFSLLQRCVRLHPFLPAGDIVVLGLVKTVAQAGDGIPGRFIRVFAKTERQNEVSLRLR